MTAPRAAAAAHLRPTTVADRRVTIAPGERTEGNYL
jgi:hypothetical protein